MGIEILTLEQFKLWIHISTEGLLWNKNDKPFTGVVLDFSNELYVIQPNLRKYYSDGKYIGSNPEEWLEKLCLSDQTDAVFRLNEWRNQVWAIEADLDFLLNQPFELFLPEGDLSGCYFKLDERIFQVLEDEDDGYRSRMGMVLELNTPLYGFSEKAVGTVVIKDASTSSPNSNYSEFDGYELNDIHTGYSWLRFGTDNCDDYYPNFIYELNIPE